VKSEGRANDIFIPPDAGLDASTGDEVAVTITKRPHEPGYNLEGRVTRVIARATGLFVGTYFEEEGAGFVRVDGTTFRDPIYVGDPGAKGAKPGDKVALEIVRYPSPAQQGEGVLTEILGLRGQPGVDTLTVIRAFNIPDTFDDDVLEEARDRARAFSEDEIGNRLDLRDRLTVTIDPATARDFDDAITLARDDRGYWSLGVHIADVSHYVRARLRPSDQAARGQPMGPSVYQPTLHPDAARSVLSNSLASLQEGRVRYTVSALMEFNPRGLRTDRQFAPLGHPGRYRDHLLSRLVRGDESP
jgi:ribonuclease R